MRDVGITAGDVGDSIVAGGDVNFNIQGVPPEMHAKALAKDVTLEKKIEAWKQLTKRLPRQRTARSPMTQSGWLKRYLRWVPFPPHRLLSMGDASLLRGEPFEAEGYYMEALRVFTDSGDRDGEVIALNDLGELSLKPCRPRGGGEVASGGLGHRT